MARKSSQGLRCKNCDTPFRADVLYDVPVQESVASMLAITCPNCESNSLLFGMGLDLPEDRARRKGETLEERLADWLADGDTGASSKAVMRYMTDGTEPRDYPHDWGDLLRVILLIDRIPEWCPRMAELAKFEGWHEIGARYEEIIEAASAADPTLRSPKTASPILKTVYHR